jgi:hypothetical protein
MRVALTTSSLPSSTTTLASFGAVDTAKAVSYATQARDRALALLAHDQA